MVILFKNGKMFLKLPYQTANNFLHILPELHKAGTFGEET